MTGRGHARTLLPRPLWTWPPVAPIVRTMRKTQFPWLLIAVLVVAYAGWHLLGLALAAVVLSVVYLASVRVHPRVRHTGFRGCEGTGEHRGSVFTWTHRKCPGCQGGRLVRWGAGHFGAQHIKSEYKAGIEGRKRARNENRWR